MADPAVGVVLALIAAAFAEPPPGMRLVDVPDDWIVVDMYGDPVDSLAVAVALEDRVALRRLRGDRRFAVLYGVSAFLAGGAAAYVAVRASSHVLFHEPSDYAGLVDDPTRPGSDSDYAGRARTTREWEQQQDNIGLVVGIGAVALIVSAPIPLLDAEPRRRRPSLVFDRATVAEVLPLARYAEPLMPAPVPAPVPVVPGDLPRVHLPEPP